MLTISSCKLIRCPFGKLAAESLGDNLTVLRGVGSWYLLLLAGWPKEVVSRWPGSF